MSQDFAIFVFVMELIGTLAFAMSGALVAIEKNLDYYGIGFLAVITAVGGGIIRDTIIDLPLPTSVQNPLYVLLSLASAMAVILLYNRMGSFHQHFQRILQVSDAIGLAAFTVIGANVALVHHIDTLFVTIILAVLTGTFGGVLRDVFVREIPYVFHKEVYAVASIAGALTFYLINAAVGHTQAVYTAFGVTLLIRLVAMKQGLHLRRVDG